MQQVQKPIVKTVSTGPVAQISEAVVYERPVVTETVVAARPVVYERPVVTETVVADRPVVYARAVVSETVVAERPVVYDRPVVSETVVAERPDVYEWPLVVERPVVSGTYPIVDDPDIRALCCRNCSLYFGCKGKARGSAPAPG